LAVEFLRRHGFRVTEADNGKSALELVKGGNFDFDMILTDVVMPGMNGPELVRELKRERPALRVLFMSGYTDDILNPEDQIERYRLIQKPFLVEDLVAKVRETLDETNSRVGIERPTERELGSSSGPVARPAD
jgi:two-component system, cell cycle sensor histidine kinase and response regulator CckA